MNIISRVARVLRYTAMASLALMMLVTVIDISMRVTMNQLVLGSVEIVALGIVAVVFLALPEAFVRREQITVDAIDQFLGETWRNLLRVFASSLTLTLLVAMFSRMCVQAVDTLEIGDLSTDLQISLFWYWVPVLIGVLFSIVSMLPILKSDIADFTASRQRKRGVHHHAD